MSDQVAIVLIALGWSGGVGLVGGFAAWAVRHRSMRLQIGLVALVAVLAVIAGMIGTANAMFLSAHDFGVVMIVAAVAGISAAALAYAVGIWFVRRSESLRLAAQSFADGEVQYAEGRGPSELQSVSAELVATSQRLAESRQREARLEQSRRELVAWVSHDLRSPLAGMRAMAEALEDGLAVDADRYHRQIRMEVDRMVGMVDDLFELSRIQAGSLSFNREPVALADVVSDAIASAAPVARARDIAVDGEIDPAVVVSGGQQELGRAVSNLLMNAIRYTPKNGRIQVSGVRDGDFVDLAVRDSCGGLSDTDITRVFDEGWRGDAARAVGADDVNRAGAGFGLAIVKGIIEAHGGEVSVHNESPGCVFTLRLPAAR